MIWLLLACTPTPQDSAQPPDLLELCSDGEDNDGDDLIDCLDPDCHDALHCYESDCDNGLDDDGDGRIDCSDPDCMPCEEDCEDGVDNDLDGLADCLDPDCDVYTVCIEFDCEDGLDNDGDGLADCLDPNCNIWCEEDCGDGVDNDADGDVDCTDSECMEKAPDCVEACDDGLDNDGDGLIDCDDDHCSGLEAPCIEVCGDGLDNDRDGDTDCWDSECVGESACIEVCGDGLDNDVDGLTDCEDSACSLVCSESDCTDSLDNDGDGRVDCDDEECWGLADCAGGLAIQVTAGQVTHTHKLEYSWYSSWSSLNLTVLFPEGIAHHGGSSGHLSCAWWASSIQIAREQSHDVFSSSIRTWEQTQTLVVNGLQSSGACAGHLSSAQLSFASWASHSATSAWPFEHHLRPAPGYLGLDGARLLAGTPSFPGGTSAASWSWHDVSFSVDPESTQPWTLYSTP